MDLYAKIYLYSTAAKSQVSQSLTTFTSDLTSLDWSIVVNDDAHEQKAIQFPDGFLFFPYMIELDCMDAFTEATYLTDIATLLERLWKNGLSAILSANFEADLPEKGGYKSLAVPFPKG